jgi:hypothetical protein
VAKHRKQQAKRAAIVGASVATAVSVAFTPGVAQAISSQTYFVGFPDWLPIGAGSTLPSDPDAIEAAILAAKDKDPLVGWGTGGVDLKPVFVAWPSGVPVPEVVADQTHQETHQISNPAYGAVFQPAHDAAYQPAYDAASATSAPAYTNAYNTAYNAAKQNFPAWQTAYNATYSTVLNAPKFLGGCAGDVNCAKQKATSAADAVAAASNSVFDAAGKAAGALAAAQAGTAAGNAAADTAGAAAVAAYLASHPGENLPATVPETVTVIDTYKLIYHTQTSGQWVSPSDVSTLPSGGQAAYVLYALQNGDLGTLAPVLNWTAYLSNVNLIAYGDGAIAAGQAYQDVIDSAKAGTYPVGTALTGPRKIIIVGENPLLTQTGTTGDPLNPPYPDPGTTPAFDSVQDGGVIDVTLLSLILIRNPGTPNGGLYARFAPLYQDLTGVNPVTPKRQDVLPAGVDADMIAKLLAGDASDISLNDLGDLQATLDSADGKPIIISLKANVGWEYDLMSDAPATANPVAWANSVASSLFLTNLLTGLDFSKLGDGAYVSPDGTLYYTIPVDDLPLLAPLRAPAQVLGLLTGNLDPNTPVADAIEPFLKILVNSAYTDVQRNADGTWTRGLDEFDVPTLFGTQTLTRQQQALMAGDLIAALGKGFGDESNQVAVNLEKQLVTALKLDVTAAQQADIEKALTAPGTNLKNVTREVGDGVSKVLTAVEPYLPKAHVPTQAELAKGQDQVGTVLVGARDDLNQAVASVNKTVGEGQNKNYQGQVALRESLNKVGIKTPAPSTPAQRKAKTEAAVAKTTANLQKVGDDIKKAVNDTVNKVKKAVSGDNS